MHTYPVRTLDSTAFLERITTSVLTHTGGKDIHRTIAREALYRITRQADTLHVSADSLVLSESLEGTQRTLNTDGFVGGAWNLLLDANGTTSVESSPFVPLALLDVSNVGMAMDDFFPPLPPPMNPKADTTDAARRHWTRMTDSAGVQRYLWSAKRETTRTANSSGSSVEAARESITEESSMAWDPARGPLSWQRRIDVLATSKVGGRDVEAEINQRIVVSRLHY